MNISHSKKNKNQKLALKLSTRDHELLKTRRKLNKLKKNNKKGKTREKDKILRTAKIKRTNQVREQNIQTKLKEQKETVHRFLHKITKWINPELINKIAINTKYIKRINPKILPLPFILTLAYGMYGDGASSLAMLAMNMQNWFNLCITPQALCGRMSKIETVNFLKQILWQAMTVQIASGFKNEYAKIFKEFTSVQIEDSTQITLHEKVKKDFKGCGGSSSAAAMKLNTVYNITEYTMSHVDIVPAAISDQSLCNKVRQRIKKGVLWIRDLGYFSISDMAIIIKSKAFFLSRLKKGINIFLNEEDEESISISDYLDENTRNEKPFDKDVYIGVKNSRIKVRIIGEKVPEEIREVRIERYKKNVIKRDKKKKMKKDYFDWFGYSVFITNVPREIWATATIVIAVYKIRWQIENLFKRIKSILQIHIIKGQTKHRVECIIYAKLISLLMAQSITSYAAHVCDKDKEISEYKLMQWLQLNNRLGNALVNDDMENLIAELIESLYLLCKNKRQTNKSTFRTVEKEFSINSREVDEQEIAA